MVTSPPTDASIQQLKDWLNDRPEQWGLIARTANVSVATIRRFAHQSRNVRADTIERLASARLNHILSGAYEMFDELD